MAKEYLRQIGNTYGFRHGVVVERAPVLYDPSTGTDINQARLPPPEAYRDMELAYRPPVYDPCEFSRIASSQLLFVLLLSSLFAVGAVLVGPLLPIGAGIVAAFFLGVMLGFATLLRSRISAAGIVLACAAPFLALLFLEVIAVLTVHRTLAVVVFGGTSFVLFLAFGAKPFEFYRDWLFAHPRLKPETRADHDAVDLSPNLAPLAVVLLIVTIVPTFSPTLAIIGVIVTAAVFQKWTSPFVLRVRAFVEILGMYMAYGRGAIQAPGTWFPRQSVNRRCATLWILCSSLLLTLAVGLDLFGPWDLVLRNLSEKLPPIFIPEDIYGTPYAWIVPAAHLQHIWLYFIALALLAVVPMFVLMAIYDGTLGVLVALRGRIESGEPSFLDDDGRTEWQWYVDRLHRSAHAATGPLGEEVREAEHLFFGVGPNAEFPVLLHQDILAEHCYIVGETGSGKTALGIAPLLIQLIRGHRDENGGRTEPPPIVILDLKGDNALFQTVKHEVENRREWYLKNAYHQAGEDKSRQHSDEEESGTDVEGQDAYHQFRYFTPEKNMASHYFNPFDSLKSEARTDIQLCHLFLDALNLNHGEGYGRSYYSRRNRTLLFEALRQEPKSLQELDAILKKLTGSRRNGPGLRGQHEKPQDTFELVSTIHALTQYEMLATAKNVDHPEQSIRMPELIENRQVAYFWLPAALESISVREIGKLALFGLLTAAIDRQRRGEKPRQVYLVIDEFQRIAGENFKIILEQARSFGICAILANQTQSDLKTHDVDLRPTIRTNTRTKMFFAVTDPEEVGYLSQSSGEELAFVRSASKSESAKTWRITSGWTHSVKTRLTRNDILAATDHPLEYILHVSRGSGYTQFGGMPQLLRTTYPLSHNEYMERMHTKWPKRDPHTVVAKKSPLEVGQEAAALAHAQLEALFAEVES